MDTATNRAFLNGSALPIFIKIGYAPAIAETSDDSRQAPPVAAMHAPDERDEDAVVRENLPLVRKIAGSLRRQLPPNMEFDDLVQAGMIGLLEAIRGFDLDRGVAFTTYASVRIHGAMLDEIRRAIWAPRSVFQKARQIEEATRSIQNESGCKAQAGDVAKRLGMSAAAFGELARDARFREFCQIENIPEFRWADAADAPAEIVEKEEFTDHLVAAIDNLPAREREILGMYYMQDMKLHEIGDEIGLTESRVCQLHKQAVIHLREQLGDWQDQAA